MEACFLTSESLSKPSHLFPSFTPKPTKSSPTLLHFHYSRPPSSSTSVCCQLGSNSSSSNDDTPIIGGDWRSFRARLVAAEKVSRPSHDDRADDPDTPTGRLGPTTSIGDKWAHPLHAPERGCLLIATEKLDGVHIFEKTVILLLSTGPVGPTGIILNRPSLMSIKETRSSVLDVAGTFSDRPLYFGGPLDEALFLLGPNAGADGGVFEEVMKGLYYGTKESVGCAAEMVKRGVVGAGDFRFFDGYCGWEKEQLQEEIRAGYWTVAACSPSVIGLDAAQSRGLWEEVLGLMGSKKVW